MPFFIMRVRGRVCADSYLRLPAKTPLLALPLLDHQQILQIRLWRISCQIKNHTARFSERTSSQGVKRDDITYKQCLAVSNNCSQARLVEPSPLETTCLLRLLRFVSKASVVSFRMAQGRFELFLLTMCKFCCRDHSTHGLTERGHHGS